MTVHVFWQMTVHASYAYPQSVLAYKHDWLLLAWYYGQYTGWSRNRLDTRVVPQHSYPTRETVHMTHTRSRITLSCRCMMDT